MSSIMAKRGKSAELMVAGELLERGYDVFIPFVDCGVDLAAKVGERFVQLQIKKSKLHVKPRLSYYWQVLYMKPFTNNKGPNIYYVFLLKRETEINCVVLPSLWIEENVDKLLRFEAKRERWHFFFSPIKDGKVKLARSGSLKGGADVTPFLNNWNQLER